MHLGGIHAAENFDSARHWYDKALSVNPHNARLHNGMAIVLMRLGNFDDARAHYEKAARVDSALKPVVLYNLACLESCETAPRRPRPPGGPSSRDTATAEGENRPGS